MDVPTDDEIRELFEKRVPPVDRAAWLARNVNGDYAQAKIDLAWTAFLTGFRVAESYHGLIQPTFAVTSDARERAKAYQSVNPDYPSPATYLEAE